MKAKSLKETRDDIEKQLQSLNIETLKLLAGDNSKAQKYVKIGQELTKSEHMTQEQIKEVSNEMQQLAKMELEKRSK